MPKKRNKKHARNQTRIVGLHAVETRDVDLIKGVEEVFGSSEVGMATEDALEDIFLPDYGGSD